MARRTAGRSAPVGCDNADRGRGGAAAGSLDQPNVTFLPGSDEILSHMEAHVAQWHARVARRLKCRSVCSLWSRAISLARRHRALACELLVRDEPRVLAPQLTRRHHSESVEAERVAEHCLIEAIVLRMLEHSAPHRVVDELREHLFAIEPPAGLEHAMDFGDRVP